MSHETFIFGMLVFYKVACLVVGWGFSYMGYRLFLADKTKPAGDLLAKNEKYALSLKGGAPGVFFVLFGTVLICFSIFKGVEYSAGPSLSAPGTASLKLLPDEPPFVSIKGKK